MTRQELAEMLRPILMVLALAVALLTAPLAAQDFPPLSGRVVDNADLLDPAQEASLTQKLEALENQSGRQLVVVTLPTLNGYDISDYGYQLGRAWGIGDAERNDGALLIVAPNERKVRIEVGYGLEGIMTDALSSLIIQNRIIPHFRENDYPGGIMAGTDSIVQQLLLPDDQARTVAEQAQQRQSGGGLPVGAVIWFILIFLFFILPMMRGRSRRRRFGGTVGDIVLWEVGSAIARSAMNGGHSGGGGWGGGGGGFSGGGGSFGGGGASGGW